MSARGGHIDATDAEVGVVGKVVEVHLIPWCCCAYRECATGLRRNVNPVAVEIEVLAVVAC